MSYLDTKEKRTKMFSNDFLRVRVRKLDGGKHKDVDIDYEKKNPKSLGSVSNTNTAAGKNAARRRRADSSIAASSAAGTDAVQSGSSTKKNDGLPAWVWAIIGVGGSIVLTLTIYLIFLCWKSGRISS